MASPATMAAGDDTKAKVAIVMHILRPTNWVPTTNAIHL